MLSIAPLNTASDAASGTSSSPFDSVDEGLFASIFSQLSDNPESTEEFSQWLMDGEQGGLELGDLSSDESLEQLLSWLRQKADDGKALPPGLKLEPEVMEKAESLFTLLAEYQQEQPITESEQAERLLENKPEESTALPHEIKLEMPTETLAKRESDFGLMPSEERTLLSQWKEGVEPQAATSTSDRLMSQEVHTVKESVNQQATSKSEALGQTKEQAGQETSISLKASTPNEISQVQSQASSLVASQTEGAKKESVEMKIEKAALTQQNSSLGGISLEEAAKLVKQSKEGASVQNDNIKDKQEPRMKEAQLIVNTSETELAEESKLERDEPQLKASSILMPPPAKHERARTMTQRTMEGENTQLSNQSQIQSLGGKQLNNDKTTEAGFNVASLFAQESDAASVEEPEAEIGNLNLKEKTLVLKKSAETNNQTVTPKSLTSLVQQQPLDTASEAADVAEAEASDLLAKSAQVGLNVQSQEVARENNRPQTALSSAERIRAETEKQIQSAPQELPDHAEALSESDSKAGFKNEQAELEHNSVLRMRRSLGELANLTMTSQTPESSSTAMGSQPLQAQQQVVQAAQETSFTQQLAQAQEKFQILQEKFAPMLGQRLFMMLDQKVQQAEIQLDPPELGSMMVRIQVNQDQQAQVSFVANNAQAKDALEQAIPRLRELFQQQQMDLVNAEVSYQQRGQGGQQGQQESRQGQFSGTQVNEDSPETLLSSQPQQIILQTGKVDFYA